jgi:alpha-tubulin suppressor-like RCC1 family protein
VQITKIAARSFSVVLTASNELIAFGNSAGSEYATPKALTFKDIGKIIGISVGSNFGIVSDQQGRVFTWGGNQCG